MVDPISVLRDPVVKGAREGISVCVPAFNEEGNIGRAIASGLQALPEYAEKFELIVVDDGSGDGTLVEAQSAAEGRAEVKVLTHGRRRGVGAALRTAYGEARHPLVFYISADNQYAYSELGKLLPCLQEADLAVGYLERRLDHPARLMASRLYHAVAGLLFGLKLRNINCIKLFRRVILEGMPLRSEGPFLDAELVIRAQNRGFRVAECPVEHRPRETGKQTGAGLRAVLLTLWEMTRYAPELRLERRRISPEVARRREERERLSV